MAKQTIEVDVPEGFKVSGGFVLRSVRMDGSAIDGHIPIRRVEPVRESRWVSANILDPRTAQVGVWNFQPAHLGGHTFVRIDYENARPVSASIEEA